MRSGRDVPGRDDAAEQPGPPTFPAEAIKPTVVRIVGTILAAWTVGGILRLAATPRAIIVTVYYGVLFAGLVRSALLASGQWGTGRFRVDFGWWARPTDGLRAIVVMWAAGMAGAVAVIPWHGQTSSNADWLTDADTASAVIFAAFAIVAAPLFEELVFRGLLQRALTSRYGAPLAIVIQGVAFGLYHFKLGGGADNLATMAYLAAGGMVFGIAAHRWQRLGPTIVAHALTNTLVTVALLA
jgi:membrane protease YdiL (CAAX protease family)